MQDAASGFDFYVIWSFGRLALEGLNPYDQSLLHARLAQLGVQTSDVLSGHVPSVLWIYALFACLPFDLAKPLWTFSVLMGVFGFALWSWWRLSGKAPDSLQNWLQFLIAMFAFSPIASNIRCAQSNFIACIGLMGFVEFFSRGKLRYAGLALSLLLLKPNIFVPLFVYLVARGVVSRDGRLLTWCLAGFLLQLGLTSLLSAAAVIEYPAEFMRSLTGTASYFNVPSLGQIVSIELGWPWTRLVVLVSGILGAVYLALRTKQMWISDFYILLPLGLIVAPFCWSHTFVIMLPSYFKLTEAMYARFGAFFSFFLVPFGIWQYAIGVSPYPYYDHYMVIIPIALFLGSLWKVTRNDVD